MPIGDDGTYCLDTYAVLEAVHTRPALSPRSTFPCMAAG